MKRTPIVMAIVLMIALILSLSPVLARDIVPDLQLDGCDREGNACVAGNYYYWCVDLQPNQGPRCKYGGYFNLRPDDDN